MIDRSCQPIVCCWSTCQPLESFQLDTRNMKVSDHTIIQIWYSIRHASRWPEVWPAEEDAQTHASPNVFTGPYDFGGVLTNTNRDMTNGEGVQKRNQAQKEMHWWAASCLRHVFDFTRIILLAAAGGKCQVEGLLVEGSWLLVCERTMGLLSASNYC